MNNKELHRAPPQGLQAKIRQDLLLHELNGHELREQVVALLGALAQHYGPSYHHSLRVAHEASALMQTLGGDQQSVQRTGLAALLHDIGKIQVPRSILAAAQPWTEVEQRQARRHPALGAQLVRIYPELASLAPIIEAHHEQPDGQGYPHGLAGAVPPLEARIIAVASAADTMLHGAQPLCHDEVTRTLLQGAGRRWDAAVVQAEVARLTCVSQQAPRPAALAQGGHLSGRERGESRYLDDEQGLACACGGARPARGGLALDTRQRCARCCTREPWL